MRLALGMAVLVGLVACSSSKKAMPPLASGTYQFQHRDREFPSSPGFPVSVRIDGFHVVVTNNQSGLSIPTGVIEEATLMWHPGSGKWILGLGVKDVTAPTVGGCGDNDPHVIDLEKREIWTCEGGA
jgi:hypothetical protein